MKKIIKWHNKEHFLNNKNKDAEEKDILYNSKPLYFNDSKKAILKLSKIKENNNRYLMNNNIQYKEYFDHLIIKMYRIKIFIIWFSFFLIVSIW